MDHTQELYLQYALRRQEIRQIAWRLADALDEDRIKNADMFDINRTVFPENKHPNATMRTLEKDLCNTDLSLLALLVSLCELGMELTQGLADFEKPHSFAAAVGERYAQLLQSAPPTPRLAGQLTEIKAQHVLKRLTAAIQKIESENCHENP